MKILSAQQIKAIDEFTIEQEPIKSIDLMERAAMACFRRLIRLLKPDDSIYIACGKGNNGGDGLAIARLLIENGFTCTAFVINHKEEFSSDAKINFVRLQSKHSSKVFEIQTVEDLQSKKINPNSVLIDAILGTGINKPVEGIIAEVIDYCNATFSKIVSIDMPSGLFADASSIDNKYCIHASLTLTFQFPKLAFMFAENKSAVPEFELLDIGLNEQGILNEKSNHYYLTQNDILSLLKTRHKFSHKGMYGHALLLAGSKGKSGAAIISSKACLRSGAGLLTVHSTKTVLGALLGTLPEAMSVEDTNTEFISEVDKPEKYTAIAFGPGVGFEEETQMVLKKLLQYYSGNLIIDADGLTILSENKTWLNFLPPSTILTPHPKEFERLTEKFENEFERLKGLQQFSMKYNCIVILKDAHTAIAMPDGNVFFNSSGNPGLAKGGSGDGLTGILLGLVARGYSASQAAIIGTFIHGYAADLYALKRSKESMLISDVIELLPKAFKELEKRLG